MEWNCPNHLIFVHCDKLVGILYNILLIYFSDYYHEILLKEKQLPCNKGNIRWQFHIPTGQCICAQGAWHNCTFTPRDARLYFSRPVALNSPDMNPVVPDYKIW